MKNYLNDIAESWLSSVNDAPGVLFTCDYLREIETIGENTNRGFRFLWELLKKGKGEKI